MRRLAVLTVLFALLGCSGGGDEASTADLQSKATFYTLPGCPSCARISQDLLALQRQNKGKLKVEIESAVSPENHALIAEKYGFTSHGLVFETPDGRIQKTLSGHDMQRPTIEAAVAEILSASTE